MKIQELELFTPNLETQTTFYSQVLELEIVEQSSTSVVFQIGHSIWLFILINKNLKKEWFPTKDEAFSSDFNMQMEEQGKAYTLNYEKEVLSITKQK